MEQQLKLHYNSPASCPQETLPLGNGSLGAMVWGCVTEELLGLNEETLWSGFPQDKNNHEAFKNLDKVRKLIFEKRQPEAEQLIQDTMLGEFTESYLPLGNLKIAFPDHLQPSNYSRSLDIARSMSEVSYECNGRHFKREYCTSYPHKAILMRFQCDAPEMDLSFTFSSMLKHCSRFKDQELQIQGQCPEHVDPNYICDSKEPVVQGSRGMPFKAGLKLLSYDGCLTVQTAEDGSVILTIKNAAQVTAAFWAVQKPLLLQPAFDPMVKLHLEDYTSIFDKVELYLGEQSILPTDERLARLKEGYEDNGLYALYFQYGRYLMISSSRKGSLPANLQGIWSWEMRAPWSSNYTININLQMNYWPVQSCNLTECFSPYSDFMKELYEEGRKTAAAHYHARGTVVHHNTDYWRLTSPVGIAHGESKGSYPAVCYAMWPMGGAWLASELFKHYEYNPDRTYLKETAYPLLKENALFLSDWLVEYNGEYVTCPSTSPENQFFTKDHTITSVDMASTMDLSIIREVFTNYLSACDILGIKDNTVSEISDKLKKLAPFRTGRFGQMLEWREEYEEPEPGHRHLSHLYGLFPGELFVKDEDLTEACRRSLKCRLENGGGHTGWSCAWIINLFAVLGDSEGAYQYLNNLLVNSTYNNLWDAHPPFQIDGNFGGTAAIANMLVQDRGGRLTFLPALPKQFSTGYARGLRVKGGKSVAVAWENNKLIKSEVY